jgi:hypothetical protein
MVCTRGCHSRLISVHPYPYCDYPPQAETLVARIRPLFEAGSTVYISTDEVGAKKQELVDVRTRPFSLACSLPSARPPARP